MPKMSMEREERGASGRAGWVAQDDSPGGGGGGGDRPRGRQGEEDSVARTTGRRKRPR